MLPIFLLVPPFWIAAQPWFLQHDAYPRLGEQMGYSLRARNINCDILLYGDSTALVTLEPEVIQQRTGLKTCNIAELGAVHWFVGSQFPLDQYLAHNTPPKFIVTMWSGASFHPEMTPLNMFYYEGVVYALSFDRGTYLWKGFVRHPDWAMEFSTWVLRQMAMDVAQRLHLLSVPRSEIEAVPREQRAGLWQFDQEPQTTCDEPFIDTIFSQSQKEESIAAFRARYTTPGTQVIVDISPMADCVKERSEFEKSNQGLHDNRFTFLPSDQFNLGSSHVIRAAAQPFSEEAAEQILRLMQAAKPAVPSRSGADATKNASKTKPAFM